MSKSKLIKKSIKDQNLVDMFNDMLHGDGDPAVIETKEKNLRAVLKTTASLLETFASGPFFKKFDCYARWQDEFVKFAQDIKSILDEPYRVLKNHNTVKQTILVCKELVVYSTNLKSDNLNDRWIINHPGLSFQIFPFTNFDVKVVWNNPDCVAHIKKYCLVSISAIYNKCYEVYGIVTSPDIDVKRFSEIIVSSIERVKNVPELSRCGDAFKKISDSVFLLENNFGNYYKDMVQSQNPNTIIESFIIDLSQGQNVNMNLTRQFRTIINFYRKQASGKIKDPKIKDLFKSLNEKMSLLENSERKEKKTYTRDTETTSDAKENTSSSDESDDSSETESDDNGAGEELEVEKTLVEKLLLHDPNSDPNTESNPIDEQPSEILVENERQ